MSLKNQQIMRKKSYNSLHDIRLAKATLRLESMLYKEKLKNSGNRLFSGVSFSLKNLSFNIRNRLLAWSLFRSVAKSNMLYDFLSSFKRGFRKTRY